MTSAGGFASANGTAAEPIRGLPFTRAYPLEDLGYVPRGVRLRFDDFGRVAVIHDDVYAVLNDTVWINLADKTPGEGVNMTNVERGADGRLYFSGRGSWGQVQRLPDGSLDLVSLSPRDPPKWTHSTSFADLVSTSDGMYFGGFNGVVFLEYERGNSHFLEAPSVARTFGVGDRVFVSCHDMPLQELDIKSKTLRRFQGPEFASMVVDRVAPLDDRHVLICSREGQLLVFDGNTLRPWAPQERLGLTGGVGAITRLPDGGVAVAVTGKGLFIFAPTGEVKASLNTLDFQRITALASAEPGVLWAAVEDAIVKVLYDSPVTTFGQRLGLPASWPTAVQWNGRLYVTSSGRLYESLPGRDGTSTRFERTPQQPENGAWATADGGDQLLIANNKGVVAMDAGGTYSHVLSMDAVAFLVTMGADLCFVIGRSEIALLHREQNSWVERAPRIPAIGNPVVVHAAKNSVWIEHGASLVGRLTYKNGRLNLAQITDLPWPEAQWVNVGLVDDLVVLTGPKGGRLFFDEVREERCTAPELERLLLRSPYWITRVRKDAAGVLWGTYRQGVVTFTPEGGDYRMDATTFDFLSDQFPILQIVDGTDIWFAGGRSLYHVDEQRPFPPARVPSAPVLVSAVNAQTNEALVFPEGGAGARVCLPSEQNSLSFRFFSGSYAWRRAPEFEYRLSGAGQWTPLDAGASLRFSGLREGPHLLEVRRKPIDQAETATVSLPFEILPPWHRTPQAYAAYAVGLLLGVGGIVLWTSRQARRRNLALERLVSERTHQLEDTMQKLNEETRNAATFAERNRIAGEIHDSLQQGLTGLMLQLDATLKHSEMTADVRSRLNVARNMVSFTRHEVQHAVWDLETPLLEGAELGEALQKLTTRIGSGAAFIEVQVSGEPIPLASASQHHLLRIAQEALTNAVRHAAAKNIRIHLQYETPAVALEISDDGVGFHADHVIAHGAGHFGLRGLQERAAKLNGTLEVRSTPGHGTCVRVVVPVEEKATLSADAARS